MYNKDNFEETANGGIKMRKIGINFSLKKDLDVDAALAKIAELGFDCIFTGMPAMKQIAKLRAAVEANGLIWESIHAPFGHMNDMWLEGEAGEIMLRELLNCVDCCVLCGVKITVVHLSSGDNAPPVTDIGRRRFTELVEYAATKDVIVAFENQRKLANLAWSMETFGPETNVGFCWDCGHESCFTPGREYMPIFGKRLLCTHIHDNHGIYDGDDHMLPFDACMDFERVARQIRESGYEGTLMLEVGPGAHELYQDMSWEAFYERAADAVKKLREMVDGPADK